MAYWHSFYLLMIPFRRQTNIKETYAFFNLNLILEFAKSLAIVAL
jgi:hypothetical protein